MIHRTRFTIHVATPHLFVIARDGTLAYQGAIDNQPNASLANTMSAHNYVQAALAALKAGRPVEKFFSVRRR